MFINLTDVLTSEDKVISMQAECDELLDVGDDN